jgi:hypothetical protein
MFTIEPQSVAGRWRASSFKSMSYHVDSAQSTQLKADLANEIITNHIHPLLAYFFGGSANAALEQQHITLLDELVSSAWDWNEWLRGSVVLLGDFQPVACQGGDVFDSQRMEEFEVKDGEKAPEHILATIGLGITQVRARGGDEKPEHIFLCKAIVASEKLFE